MPKRDAESFKTRIEHLLTAQITKRPVEGDTARWVASLDDVLAGRLAAVGLIRQRESVYLAGYIDAYIAGRTDLKVSPTIPIFPELRPHLDAAFDQAAAGSVHVITRQRNTNANLRTHLSRIIERAGLEPWRKLFQNLRSPRETELAEQFPMHVVC